MGGGWSSLGLGQSELGRSVAEEQIRRATELALKEYKLAIPSLGGTEKDGAQPEGTGLQGLERYLGPIVIDMAELRQHLEENRNAAEKETKLKERQSAPRVVAGDQAGGEHPPPGGRPPGGPSRILEPNAVAVSFTADVYIGETRPPDTSEPITPPVALEPSAAECVIVSLQNLQAYSVKNNLLHETYTQLRDEYRKANQAQVCTESDWARRYKRMLN